jgi:hypothetical protein
MAYVKASLANLKSQKLEAMRVSVKLAESREERETRKIAFEEAGRRETDVKGIKNGAKNGFVIACMCDIWCLDKELSSCDNEDVDKSRRQET